MSVPSPHSNPPNASMAINRLIEDLGTVDYVMDAESFDSFCQRAFYGINEGKSPRCLFQSIFDTNGDGKLSAPTELDRLKSWVDEARSRRKSALIIVDVQNDFIDGPLSIKMGPARQDPTTMIDSINDLIDTVPFDLIVYTQDWHPADHISFLENVTKRRVLRGPSDGDPKLGDDLCFLVDGSEIEQRVWPTHCVANTNGAALDPRLRQINDPHRVLRIYKGIDPLVEAYSAFFYDKTSGEIQLHEELARRAISDLYVCGLAYDVCVAATVQDALRLGYKTAIIDDCTRGLVLDDIRTVKDNTRKQNGIVVDSRDVLDLTAAKRVPWNWAYDAACKLTK